MKWTQRYGVVAIAITVVLVLVFVLQQKRKLRRVSPLNHAVVFVALERYEEETRQMIESLQNRINYVSHLNDEHLQELSSIKQQNLRLIRSLSSMKACQRRLASDMSNQSLPSASSNSNVIDESINEKTVDSLKNGFHLPLGFSYLRHLSGKHDMLTPAFRRQTSNLNLLRSNVSFIIGVPTVKRDKQSYLVETIKSLIDNINADDIERLLIVIFIAEPFDIEYVRNTAHDLEKLYDKHIESGLIEIISPPMEFYPDFDQLKLSLNDDKQRVKWRTKQNYDFTYVMMYSAVRGHYYIQLEDDVVTKPGYIQTIDTFIRKQLNQSWFMLEYSSLGMSPGGVRRRNE